jgi:hypothetical protein
MKYLLYLILNGVALVYLDAHYYLEFYIDCQKDSLYNIMKIKWYKINKLQIFNSNKNHIIVMIQLKINKKIFNKEHNNLRIIFIMLRKREDTHNINIKR